jgi:two-component system CheB/CheR fusion protein
MISARRRGPPPSGRHHEALHLPDGEAPFVTTMGVEGASMSSASTPPRALRSDLPFPIVGLGASAGGLAALMRFFESIPASSGMAFVVVLHLSPKHESNAAAILQRATRMTVGQVTQDQRIEADHVYVIPPNRALLMVDGHLCLGPAERVKGGHVLIDVFFRTLAQAHRERAIAIVLSGTGADGAVGIGEVKEQGGVVIAQDPQDAEYADMPASAIATGRVDIVLPVAEMGQRLLDLWRNAQDIELPEAPDDELAVRQPRSPEAAERALARIMGLLHTGTGHDFKHYKRATVLRRIERRLQVNGLPHLPAYADFLSEHPQELPRLLADMLIGVTNFFRDREAFEALERQVVPELFDDALQGEPLRVWVPGCSTGEEAYSLAMLVTEGAEAVAQGRPVQVFATDIDEEAIARGREGLYPGSIVTDIAPTVLRRHFTKEGLHYRVAKPLRDRVLFASHNLLRDPPFSRVDLISCRNLLIYLEREVQAEILQMFHFALRPGGWLFLGSSETAEAASKLFTIVDKKNRIYRANSAVRATRVLPRFPLGSQPVAALAAPIRGAAARPAQPIGELHNRLLLDCAPPSVVVNDEGDILHIAGAEQYLRFPTGVPSQHLLSVIQPALRPTLRAAMFDVEQGRQTAQATTGITGDDGQPCQLTITVRSVQHPDWPRELRLVLFQQVQSKAPLPPAEPGHRDPLIAHLEGELQRKDQQLQRSVEQYEISVEDLKASNEELQAINEELRSATEELETSKEELQSTNEELITVNHELKAKVEETAETNDDLRNLIASTGIATIFLERDLRIKRFTPQATELFNIIGSDVGRSLMDITHKLDYDRLAEDAAEAFRSLRVVEREVAGHDGRAFLARMLPYRTAEDRIDGAVLSLVDITALRDAQRSVHIDQERMQLIAQSMPGFAIMTMDEAGRFTSWSVGARELFGFEEAEVIGRHCELIFTPEDRAAGIPQQEMQQARQTGRANDERWHLRRDGSRVFVSGIMAPMRLGRLQGYAKIVRDMTDSKQAETSRTAMVASALDRAERAQAANDLKDETLAIISHELKHPLNLIQISTQMLMAMPEVQPLPRVVKALRTIEASGKSQARIIDDLLDLSRTRAGKLVLEPASVYLKEALASCFDWAAEQAQLKGIDFQLEAVEDTLLVDADLTRLRQVVMNLLSNALKFTPTDGGIKVRLVQEGNEAVLSVRDSGRGISPEALPGIFEMFNQGDVRSTRQSAGLGIGLALVRELVHLHGGSVQAQSDGEGRGSCFIVRLPLRHATDFGSLGAPAGEPSLQGLRILLVDDGVDALETFALLLQLEGAEVATAASGAQALELAAARPFDLLISDIGMPVMDGHMLIGELRRSPPTAALKAIALTGYGTPQDRQRSIEAGFDICLGKPLEMARLKAAIEQLGLVAGG